MIIKKRPIKKQFIHLILFILFNILFYFLDVFENYKLNDLRSVGFEYYVPNFYVYLIQNLYFDIEYYGTTPYYYYLVLITKHFYFPFGLFFLISFLICILINRNNILVWLCLPFFLIHSYIGHKELRFLFPILLLTPFFFIESYTFFKKYNNFLLKALFKFIVILNIIYFVILNFNFYSNRIALFKFIDRNYKTTDELYVVEGNPFVKSDIPFVFFMNDFPRIRLLNDTSVENIKKDLFLKNIKSFDLLVTGKKNFKEFSNLNAFCHLQYSTLPLFLTKINIRVNTSYSLIYKCNNIN
jgi:phosphatidylinositol glycan class B